MNKDKIIGAAMELKGSIETAVGDTVDSTKMKIDGIKDQAEGKAQAALGTVKDFLKK